METWNHLKPTLRYSKKKRYEYIINCIHEIDNTVPLILKFKDLPVRLRENKELLFNYIINSLYIVHGDEPPVNPWGYLPHDHRMSKIKRYAYIVDLFNNLSVKVTIYFKSNLADVDLKVDDKSPDSTSTESEITTYTFNKVTLGNHVYTAMKEGYETKSNVNFTVESDKQTFDLTLIEKVTSIIEGDTGATIIVDGDKYPDNIVAREGNISDYYFDNISVGEHRCRITKEDYQTITDTFTSKSPNEIVYTFNLTPSFADVEIKLTNEDDEPITDDTAIVKLKDKSNTYTLTYDPRKQAYIKNKLLPGRYTLTYELSPFAPEDMIYDINGGENKKTVQFTRIRTKIRDSAGKTDFNKVMINSKLIHAGEDGTYTVDLTAKPISASKHQLVVDKIGDGTKTYCLEFEVSHLNHEIVFSLEGETVKIIPKNEMREVLDSVKISLEGMGGRVPKYITNEFYRFDYIPDGTYSIHAEKSGYLHYDGTITVKKGEITTYDFTMYETH